MLSTVKKLVYDMNVKNAELENEVKRLKQKLQFRHTEINDLRYSKRMLQKKLEEQRPNSV
jgi:hypothetical protein